MIDYSKLGQEIGELVTKRILYPDGIYPDQLDDALAIVRVIDKLFRLATNNDEFEEYPWTDIVGYGLLGLAKELKKAENG